MVAACCDARPFGTHKHNRRELEALHLQAIQRIAKLEAQLEANEHSPS